MKRFFDSDNRIWRSINRLADYFLVSICWLLCSLPLLTLGTASIALYDTVAHCIKGDEGHMLRRFFQTFRRELLRGILLTLLWTGAAWLLYAGYQYLVGRSADSNPMTVVSIVYYCSLLIPLGCLCWSLALESRFTASFCQLLKNSFAFTFAYLPTSCAVTALFVLAANLCLNFPVFLAVIPGIMVHLQSHFIEKVFQKHMPAEEDTPE